MRVMQDTVKETVADVSTVSPLAGAAQGEAGGL